mmetsp:Transcript_12444/g.39395  ORF Transcript_12444/g.39395 Transcript_12444/m.39395 type:complete len:175 (-) Transcript_12444:79-603(-)|eukprot:CAMPEP_0182913576 /NCGR_PEP_ID=MMETSP0034_2-20130328/38112_1 /TAXON_ID=156128 /ORGANISM="Nephroselmis pyriformis, Strain CCMP717" /LENGTH=174 /DNA_ID=CAMNT_0025050303 /DNA_START=31 /DNA_END=555 /DNA_ORIENTATION=+
MRAYCCLAAALGLLVVLGVEGRRQFKDDVELMPWITDMDEKHEHDEYYIDRKGMGLTYIDYVDGDGEQLKRGDEVEVMYKMYLQEGHKFIYSHPTPKDAVKMKIGRTSNIRAFPEGLTGMRRGGKRVVFVPPAMGFGDAGSNMDGIPPHARLMLYLEVVAPPKPKGHVEEHMEL